MIKIASLSVAGALLACGLCAVPAHALPTRAWVSGKGTDAGACTVTAPCRTFAFALTQTAAGGEIDVLDPASYGTVAITQAISTVNDGVGEAGIEAPSGSAITINAGASDSVHLRGLTIEGLGTGSNGILFNTGGNVAIENCVIRGFSIGINISPSTSSSFSVSNTIASNNGGYGINVQPGGSTVVTGVLSKVITNNNPNGIVVAATFTGGGSLNVTIVDSEVSNNGFGINAASASGNAATAVMLRNVVASNNNFVGLKADSTAILRVAHSVVTGNSTGLSTFGGTIFSYGDNDIDGNTNDNTGVLTKIPTH
jgi:hypothetical protein